MVNLEKMAKDMEKLEFAEMFNNEIKKHNIGLTNKQLGVVIGCFMKVISIIHPKTDKP